MLELSQINGVVKKAASTALKPRSGVKRVSSAPMLDSHGQEALQITIVLKRGTADRIDGDTALNTLVSIDQALQAAKEDRFPIIDYVTEEELEAGDDTEC